MLPAGCTGRNRANTGAVSGSTLYLGGAACGFPAIIAVNAATGAPVVGFADGGVLVGVNPSGEGVTGLAATASGVTASFVGQASDGGTELLVLQFDATGQQVGTFTPLQLAAVEPNAALMVADSSGRTYVTFETPPSARREFVVTRLLANGTPDSSFGTGGTSATVSDSNRSLTPKAIVLSGDKVVIVGVSTLPPPGGGSEKYFLARLTATGALDATFGTGGVVISSNVISDQLLAAAVQSGDRIVALGNEGTASPFVTRFTAAGAVDTTFGTNGQVSLSTVTTIPFGVGLVLAADGSVWAAGQGTSTWTVHLTADGQPDTALGPGGRQTFPASSVYNSMLRGAGGLFLVGGTSSSLSNGEFATARLVE